MNLVDVRDAAEGLILAMERGHAGHRYVLGGESMPLRRVLELMAEISGRRVRCIQVNGKVAEMVTATLEFIADHVTHRPPSGTAEGVRIALRAGALSIEKAQRELGYAPARSNRSCGKPLRICLTAATIKLNGAQRRVRALDRFTSSTGWRLIQSLNGPRYAELSWSTVGFRLSGWTTTWPTQLLAIIWILWVISWVFASFLVPGETRNS